MWFVRENLFTLRAWEILLVFRIINLFRRLFQGVSRTNRLQIRHGLFLHRSRFNFKPFFHWLCIMFNPQGWELQLISNDLKCRMAKNQLKLANQRLQRGKCPKSANKTYISKSQRGTRVQKKACSPTYHHSMTQNNKDTAKNNKPHL